MESEELRLLRENNLMLKLIITYLRDDIYSSDAKDFIMNVLANQVRI